METLEKLKKENEYLKKQLSRISEIVLESQSSSDKYACAIALGRIDVITDDTLFLISVKETI